MPEAANPPAPIVYPLAGKRVWVAGHTGMVGSHLVRRLSHEGCEVVTTGTLRVDLTRQAETEDWLAQGRPDAVFIAAARVGGILANDSDPVDFLYDNLMIAANVTHAAARTGVEKLLFLGSSCIYPRLAPQPIPEDALLTGPLEPTNEWYAIAKIAGIKLAEAFRRQEGRDFISVMPTNLYGPGDNFDLASAHVVPALLRKAHEAKGRGEHDLTIWGSGTPRREFLHVEDCADGLIHLMKSYSGAAHVNLGYGSDVTIRELAEMIMAVVGLDGNVICDPSKPDGTPRKLLDSRAARALGWSPTVSLKEGLAETYRWYCERATVEGNRHNEPARPDDKLI